MGGVNVMYTFVFLYRIHVESSFWDHDYTTSLICKLVHLLKKSAKMPRCEPKTQLKCTGTKSKLSMCFSSYRNCFVAFQKE